MREVLSDLNIVLDPPAPKESWAHGLLERAVQEVKDVASKIRLTNTDLMPETVLALATHALNSTEYVQGYTPFQWVYGSQPSLTFEDTTSFELSADDPKGLDYGALLKRRQEAEDAARRGYTPFQWVYGSQPSLTFEDTASFELSADDPKGLDYGALLKRRQEAEDAARRVKAMRTLNKIKNSKVRQPLQTFHPMDLVKIWRKYTSPVGPRGCLKKTARPQWLGPGRVVFHETIHGQRPDDQRRHIVWVVVGGTMHRCSVHSVRKVTTQERLDFELHSGEDPSQWKSLASYIPQRSFAIGNTGIGSGVPTLDDRSGSSKARLLPSETDAASSEPDAKKPRHDADDLLLSYLEQVDECYVLEFDLVLENDHQQKRLLENPSLFLAQKMRDCEVRLEKLTPAHRELFRRAKMKEVNSFLSNKAVRRCEDGLEEETARNSGRLMRCRWV
eukprot:s2110_g4.t1